MTIKWTDDLDTGIDIIDEQHKRIVDYINELEGAIEERNSQAVSHVVNEVIDYTMSHFGFEENLQEEAGYVFCKPHKKVHELFTRRVVEFKEKLDAGEDVAADLHKLLATWLVSHIKREDADYVAAVKSNMLGLISEKKKKDDGGWFRRFFK